MKKPRHRADKWRGQGHTVGKGQRQSVEAVELTSLVPPLRHPWGRDGFFSRTWVFFLWDCALPPQHSFLLAWSWWTPLLFVLSLLGREEEAKGRDWKAKGRSCWETPEDARRWFVRRQEALQMFRSQRVISQGIFFPRKLSYKMPL